MKRNIARTVALTLAIAFLLSIVSTTTTNVMAAGWTANSWTFPVIDDWEKSLAKNEARGYLYNSTGRTWENWVLLASGDVWVNDTGSYITFSNLRKTWNNTDSAITYTLVIKLKIDGELTPITIYNATVLTITPQVNGTGYLLPFAYKDLGEMSQFGVDGFGPVTPVVDDMSDPIEVWLYYKAFKLMDQMDLPVTVSDVEVFYTSTWDPPANQTWITTSAKAGIYGDEYWTGVTNGTYDPPTNGLVPVQDPFFYEADCTVGWVVVKLPLINRSSLVSNMTFVFYYHGTLVANFSANDFVPPAGNAWGTGTDIVGTVGPDWVPTTEDAVLEYNTTEWVYCNIDWYEFPLWDQEGNPWPTRNAKITLYDVDIGSKYPWPGVISPDYAPGMPAFVWLRYPAVNHTVKIVTTWFDNTVNVTYIDSSDTVWGGYELPRIISNGLVVDMVQVWIKVYSSTQVPAPLDPNWVDEVKIRIESRTAPRTTYIAKLSYWHGYIILPDTPFAWWLSGGFGVLEEDYAMGWLPSGNWSTIDFFIKFKGLEVVNTVTRYPVNGSLKLVCPGTPSDYGRTFYLYAGVYDVGFKVLLGCENKSDPAPEYTPLILTTPEDERILVTTDGQGVITLRDVPSGTYEDFTILFKMLPVNCTFVKVDDEWEPARPVMVNASTKPLIELLFPVYNVNMTVWNFEKTFKIINLNVSLYNTVDYSKFGINNDLLRRALDVEHKRSIVFPDGWAILEPIQAEAPGDLGDLIDYLGDHPTAYSTIWYRTEYYLSGEDTDDPLDGVPDWPMEIGLMPAANYSVRVSVMNGTQNAVDTGFRPADYNATVYWSEDPYPGVGKLEVSDRTAVKQVVLIDLCTYIYNVPVQTLDASGQPLTLADMSAVILAEPFSLALGTDTGLDPAETVIPRQLWYMQQWDPDDDMSYNAYLVRFNTSDTNTFHSVNATVADSPMDPDLGIEAEEYPHQSRYLIGGSTLEPTKDNYTFNVYYQGVLVYNDSIPLTNPYTIGTAGHAVTGAHKLLTSVYPYVFEATNDHSLDEDNIFGIANLEVEVYWAGLNTTWWPTVNLTYRTAPVEFALLNASKLFKGFNMTVVERQWGNVSGMATNQSIVLGVEVPYYSSFVKIVNGTTDDWGEFKCLVPVWNYSIGTFPTFMGTVYANGTWLGDQSPSLTTASRILNPALEDAIAFPFNVTIGGPRLPWLQPTWNAFNLTWRTESLFGTPVFVNYTTIPGKTNNVPALDDPRLVGVGPGYIPWVNYKAINATGLINPATVDDNDDLGVSYTMDTLGVRAYGTGVLVNNNVSNLIYGDFQGRSPELAHSATKPYKEEGNKIAPPQAVSNFFAKVDSKAMANDLWVWVRDYAGNALAFQRVEIIRANYTFTRDDEDIVLQPELWTVQYTPRVWPYGPVKIASKPNAILWGFYDVIVRTTNLSDAEVVGTTVVTDHAKEEMESLELYGHQWLYEWLHGGDIDWTSTEVELQWDAKLDVQIKAGDGSTPIEKAWVFLIYGTNWAHDKHIGYFPPDPEVDPVYGLPAGLIDWGYWEIGHNATAGLTDAVGFAASLKVGNAKGPLATSDGTALNLGFNVYEDVYTVKVYYKYLGSDTIYGPVSLESVVWDTFTDQPQHRYIYLGVEPPATATGEDWSNAQHKIYGTRIWNLKITLVDSMGRPLTPTAPTYAGAMVTILGKTPIPSLETGGDGSVQWNKLPSGNYTLAATWSTMYNDGPVEITRSSVSLDRTLDNLPITASVYDVTIQLVTPSGKPIANAPLFLNEILVGNTDGDGKVLVGQLPSKYSASRLDYPVRAIWFDIPLEIDTKLVVTSSKTYPLIAGNVATLTVQVVGAQGQGLSAAAVDITNSAGYKVFSGVTNEQGIVNTEVPFDTYTVHTDYKGFTSDTSTTVSSAAPAPLKVANSVFLEIFGQAMTFATFVLWIIVIVIVVLVLAVVVHEYHVWRRKRLPQLFGAPRVPGA